MILRNLMTYSINSYINNIFILYAFSIPFYKDITRILAFILLALWMIEGNYREKSKEILNNRVIVAFSIFVIYSFISIFWSEEKNLALHYVSKYFYYLVIPIMYTSIKKEYIPKLLLSFLVGMLLSEIITYGVYFEFWTTAYNERVISPSPTSFMGHSAYSLFVVLTAALTLNKLLFFKNTKPMIIFYTVLFLFAFGNILISGGRTGLISLLIFMIIFTFIHIKNFKYVLVFISIIIGLLFFGYKNIEIFKQRLDQSYKSFEKVLNNNYRSSIGTRVALVNIGIEIAKDNPVFGVGIKDNITKRVEYAAKNDNKSIRYFSRWSPKSHYHNEYIEILTSIGLVGLSMFLYFIFTLYNERIKSVYFNNLKIIFVTSLVFGTTTSAMFHHREPIALFGLFIGLILLQSKFERENGLK